MNSIIKKQEFKIGDENILVKKEEYSSVYRMANDLKEREITDSGFDDISEKCSSSDDWYGSTTYTEALEMLKKGYDPSAKKLKETLKLSLKRMTMNGKRVRFEESVEGFQPIVPLAIMNIPTSMLDVKIKNIKERVISIYYDNGYSSLVSSDDIIKFGQSLFEVIIKLESSGYRINLYVTDGYCDYINDTRDIDLLVVKIKSSNQILDIKKMSFPMTHTAFFRILGFDWYSKTPNGKYKMAYGCSLTQCCRRADFNKKEKKEFIEKIFGKNAVYISGESILDKTSDKEKMQQEIINELKHKVKEKDLEMVRDIPRRKKDEIDPFLEGLKEGFADV